MTSHNFYLTYPTEAVLARSLAQVLHIVYLMLCKTFVYRKCAHE